MEAYVKAVRGAIVGAVTTFTSLAAAGGIPLWVELLSSLGGALGGFATVYWSPANKVAK
jgi:hypothetical protein